MAAGRMWLQWRKSHIALACAVLSIGAAAGLQATVAHFDYGGNWTAFFRIGSGIPLPPVAAQEQLYRFPGGAGYDGQFYRLIAQDPLLMHGTARYIDAPRLRYRRILVPALAGLLAFGNPSAATYTYIVVVILFLWPGAYWLSRYATLAGLSGWWGVAFLFVPGVFLSLDRLTVDIAIAALTVGFALYWRAGPLWKLYIVLLLAPLSKETGFLLVAGYILYLLLRRNWKRALAMGTAALPAAFWWLYVQVHTSDYPAKWARVPFAAAMHAMLHPELYPLRKWFVTPFDYLAWLGLILAIALAIVRLRTSNPLCLAALFLAALAAVVNFSVWQEVEAFGRVFTPLFLLLPLARPDVWSALPLLAVIPRASALPISETIHALSAMQAKSLLYWLS